MIYTLTVNPSLDYVVSVEEFQTGRVNRTTKELIYPGGKGINVSLVMKNLGFDSTAFGFLSGFTGDEIERLLENKGIQTDFIHVKNGLSRINVKLRSTEESEINGQGPKIAKDELEALYQKLDLLKSGDVLVLAGSIPATMPESLYRHIMERLSDKELKIVVDATKDLLVNVLKYHPFLVKPNHHELSEIFGVELGERKEVIPYAKKLREMGAENVLVSMAGAGAVLIDANGSVYESEAPTGTVVNSVGAGDSMVAGFLAGYLQTGDYFNAFRTGICCGSASAFSEELVTKEEMEKIAGQSFACKRME